MNDWGFIFNQMIWWIICLKISLSNDINLNTSPDLSSNNKLLFNRGPIRQAIPAMATTVRPCGEAIHGPGPTPSIWFTTSTRTPDPTTTSSWANKQWRFRLQLLRRGPSPPSFSRHGVWHVKKHFHIRRTRHCHWWVLGCEFVGPRRVWVCAQGGFAKWQGGCSETAQDWERAGGKGVSSRSWYH